MSGFLTVKRTLGCKIEGTPYTAETLAAADYDVAAFDITHEPSIPVTPRKLAYGDLSQDVGIAGRQSGTIKFSVWLQWSGTNATAPKYFKCLRACGMKQTTYGSTGINLVTHADYCNVPMTMEVVERDEGAAASMLVYKYRGCMGNATISLNSVGEPVKIDFEFKGVLVSVADRAAASTITPASFDTTLPEAILSSTTTIFTEAIKYSKVTINLGNTVELWSDPSKAEGYEGARIISRNPTMDVDPDMVLIASSNMYGRLILNTTGALSWNVGNHITISAPKIQIEDAYKPGEREGHVIHNMKLGLKRNSGNDELKILQGAEA